MMDDLINEIEIRKTIQQIHSDPENQLFEVRIIGKNKSPISGFFKDADTLIQALKKVDLRNTNVYFTINPVDEDLYSRQQRDHFEKGANGAGDNDITGYDWLFIDLDPIRKTGISSTDEELKKSYELAGKIYQFLKDYGFEEPVKAVSGNGAHLLYKINLDNTEANKALIQKCLKALSMMFDTDAVKVDLSNHNQSRVCKLYGTLAQKGANTDKRPHRMSRIIGDVKEVKDTDKAYLEKLAAELPEELPAEQAVRPAYYNNYNPKAFDIEDWMNKNGISYIAKAWNGGTKYILDECPFDSSHKAPDSMITKAANGAIGFKCLHNSCQNYHWRELRLKFEPDAYDDKFNDNDRRIEEGWAQHNRDKKNQEVIPVYQKDNIPVWQTAEMILEKDEPEPEYIRTGINKIDKQLGGLEKTKITILTGLRASAKSTLLSQLMLNSLEDGHVVLAYSGELTDKSFMNWMYLQAAGKGYVKQSAKYENNYYVEFDIRQKIAKWMNTHLWLYNNIKPNKAQFLLNNIRAKCIETKADLIILDNLMALDIQDYNNKDLYDAQTQFMWSIKKIAQDCNVHIILVAHPRKSVGFLRLEDVSGSNNLVNIIDNALIVHRVNADFKEKAKMILKATGNDYIIDSGTVTNVVEIAKDREHGTCDFFVDLYYEPESKRLKNYAAESIVYGWNNEWSSFSQEEIPFDL